MKNIYFTTSLMWNHSAKDIIRFARDEMMEGIEIWHQQFLNCTPETKRLFKETETVGKTVHALSWDLNFSSVIPRIREVSLALVKSSIEFTASIGAKEVTIHPGRMTIPNTFEVSFANVVYGVNELIDFGKQNGVTVSLEIMERLSKEVVVSLDEANQIAKECPECVFTLDIAHCDSLDILYEFLASDLKISKFHVSNRKGKVLHTPLAQGDYPMGEIVSVLQQYNKPIVIEGFDPSKEIELLKENIHYLKSFKGDLREEKISSNSSEFIGFDSTGRVFL